MEERAPYFTEMFAEETAFLLGIAEMEEGIIGFISLKQAEAEGTQVSSEACNKSGFERN